MSKYLYGASLQGLQAFIFQTNKLREIIGASEMIKTFDTLNLKEKFELQSEPLIILQAAGNLRAIIDNEEDAKKIVKFLPINILPQFYGINLSQALVKLEDYKSSSLLLEQNLKIQRNKNALALDYHFSIFDFSPRTGLSATNIDKNRDGSKSKIDKSTDQKQKAYEKARQLDTSLRGEIEDISNTKNKIAIIHIDGNGLGNIVRTLNEHQLKDFSSKLDNATKCAYESATAPYKDKIRKIILGGDDVTLICNANIALDFTHNFLTAFEANTHKIYNDHSLSACAGIAYCNQSYPFFYAVKLAEDLCSYAKKDSKSLNKALAPSSIMFHNIQSSNVQSFSNFLQDELTINNISCCFGPYYLKDIEHKPSLHAFLALKNDLAKPNAPKGRLRDWLSAISFNRLFANDQARRIAKIFANKWKSERFSVLHKDLSLAHLIVDINGVEKTPIYDLLQILSVEDPNTQLDSEISESSQSHSGGKHDL